MKKRLLAVKVFGLTAGISLLVYVLRQIDVEVLADAYTGVPLWGWTVLAFYPLIAVWDLRGWIHAFPDSARHRLHLFKLFWIRLSGDSINNVTPLADIGGEFLKVHLASGHFGIPRRQAVSAVLADRTTLMSSEILFWIIGLLTYGTLYPDSTLTQRGWIVAAIFIVLIVVVIWLQRGGALKSVAAFLTKRAKGTNHDLMHRMSAGLDDIHVDMDKFYSFRNLRWWGCLFWHEMGWLMGSVETYFMLRLLGVEVSFVHAVVLEACVQWVRTASFFIPGNLGAQEGFLALCLREFGQDAALGVGLSFFKRMRQGLWTLCGFAAGWYLFRTLPKETNER